METWKPHNKEQQESPDVEAVIRALEQMCGEHHEFARTRELLAQAYPDACTRAQKVLEGNV
jgi:hypothetical protein